MTFKHMNKVIKAKWIKALRSGRYKQAQGKLELDGAYCCLGVLENKVCKIKYTEAYKARHGLMEMPARKTQEATKLTHAAARKLAALNDYEMLSFPEIADWIQENL